MGWRWSAITVGLAAISVAPLVALLVRNRPADVGLRAYGETAPDEVPAAPSGSPILNAFRGLRLGVRSRDFWLLAGSFFICGASTNGLIGTHLIPASMAFAAGAVRTVFGDYQLAFMFSGLLCLLAAGLVLRIARFTPAAPPVPVAIEQPVYS